MRPFVFGDASTGAVHVSQESVAEIVDPAVNRQMLVSLPRVLDDRRLAHMMGLLDDIALAQPIYRRGVAVTALDQPVVAIMNIPYVPQPVVDQSQRRFLIRRSHASTSIVAAHDHVF